MDSLGSYLYRCGYRCGGRSKLGITAFELDVGVVVYRHRVQTRVRRVHVYVNMRTAYPLHCNRPAPLGMKSMLRLNHMPRLDDRDFAASDPACGYIQMSLSPPTLCLCADTCV